MAIRAPTSTQRHQHERHRPGGRADLVRDAEAAHGRLEAVADRERERHPGADPQDEQAAGDPADPGEGDAAARRRERGLRSRRGHQREPDCGQQNDEDEVVAGGRERVEVLRADEEHEDERNDHAPAVEFALPGLAKHEKDERRVEEILASSHVAMIRGRRCRGIGARVETAG